MAELVVVHKTMEADVSRVITCLENRCLHPVVLDDVEKMGPYRSQTHEIRIAVPEAEYDMAIRILAQREQHDRLRLFPVIKRTNVVVLFLLAILGLLALVGLLDRQGLWFAALGTLVTIIAALALIRWAWRREPDAPSAEPHDPTRRRRPTCP